MPSDELPLHRFFGPVRRAVGEGVNSPRLTGSVVAIRTATSKGLPFAIRTAGCCSKQIPRVVAFQSERRQPIAIRGLRELARMPFVVVVINLPQRDAGVGDLSAEDGH